MNKIVTKNEDDKNIIKEIISKDIICPECKENILIDIDNFKINFPKKLSKFELYDTIETEKKLKVFSNFYLPISIIETTFKESKKTTKKYSIEEATTIGEQELTQELDNQIENKESILRKKRKLLSK